MHAPQSSQALPSVLIAFAHLLACPHASFRGFGAGEGLGNREYLGAERQGKEDKQVPAGLVDSSPGSVGADVSVQAPAWIWAIISPSFQSYGLEVCLFYSVGTTDCRKQMPSVHHAL